MTFILEWLAGWLLNYLLGKAISETKIKLDQLQLDKERGQINDENVAAYNEAKTREERRRDALLLLNRTKRP